MTFPSPFATPEIPGFDDAAKLQAEHGQAIQAMADGLYQAGAEAQKKLKTQLATGIKGKLVRAGMKAQKPNGQERTRIAAQMRHDGEVSQANNDAEIMRLAPRLGAYEADASLMRPDPLMPVAPAPLPPVGPTAPPPGPQNCPPGQVADWIYLPNGTGVVDNFGQCHPAPGGFPPPAPPGYTQFGWDYGRCLWAYRRCTDGAPIPITTLPPPPPPGIVPPPPPVPPPCPPCPVQRCGPDGIPLLGPPSCPQGPPPDAGKSASYVVPWLSGGETAPSIYSDCGRKLIADAAGNMDGAAELVNALSSPQWVNVFLGRPRVPLSAPLLGERDYAEDDSPGLIYRE